MASQIRDIVGGMEHEPGLGEPDELSRAGVGVPETPEVPGLPVMPGFREMAERRKAERQLADERTAAMAAERQSLVHELAAQRQAAGLSQTEVAAMMGTSQSAVARLESGTADVRASTLERYAAAIGSELNWRGTIA
jgi:DNA-binding transcriptional regulator YiaG